MPLLTPNNEYPVPVYSLETGVEDNSRITAYDFKDGETNITVQVTPFPTHEPSIAVREDGKFRKAPDNVVSYFPEEMFSILTDAFHVGKITLDEYLGLTSPAEHQ